MLTDIQLEQIAIRSGIKIPADELEQEVKLLNAEAAHKRQYDALMNGMSTDMSQPSEEAWEGLKLQALRNLRIQHLIDETIRKEDFKVTKEELEEEANALAKRQNTSLDMVRGFFGEDFALLKRDVLEKKALEYLQSTDLL